MSGKELLGGVVLGAVLGAGGFYAVEAFVLDDAAACGGVCGEGTVCEAGHCELAPEDTELEPEDTEPVEAGKRKRRRGAKGGADDEALASDQGPPLDDDSKVPRFNPNQDQSISMSDGSGRLSDSQVDRELAKLDGRFQACVSDGAARVDDLGRGTVKLAFGVDGGGKVTGVNVTAPANLKDAGIVPCVRKAVYGHKFPAFDGPTMKVSSSFSVD